MKSKAFEDLLDLQSKLTKGENLMYGNLEIRSYLTSNQINSKQAQSIFRIRTRMTNVKNNYKQSYNDLLCPCCNLEQDTQEHMMMHCKKMTHNISKKEYYSLFGQNEEDMAKVIKKVEDNEHIRKTFLET